MPANTQESATLMASRKHHSPRHPGSNPAFKPTAKSGGGLALR